MAETGGSARPSQLLGLSSLERRSLGTEGKSWEVSEMQIGEIKNGEISNSGQGRTAAPQPPTRTCAAVRPATSDLRGGATSDPAPSGMPG